MRERAAMSNPGHSELPVMECKDIQEVLFAYMTRELGEARSELVREHLRKCPECQRAAGENQATLEELRKAAISDTGLPERLSEKRRARVLWAFMHPALDWIYVHHIMVSALTALLVLAAALVFLVKMRIWEEPPEAGPTVIIGKTGHGPAGSPATNAPGLIRAEEDMRDGMQ